MKRILAAALGLLGTTAMASAAERPVVVELFTSQGCSSCPPAEAVLSDLARNHPEVLALGFHVDYWDRLGWKDPFSDPAATRRQRNYQRTVGSEQIYTPQMIVDGRFDVLGSDRGAALAAIRKASAGTGEAVSARLSRAGQDVSVVVGPGSGSGRMLLIGYDPSQETAVRRGENAGRTISQANVVRSVTDLGEWRGKEISLARPRPAGERLVLLVQGADGRVAGVGREQ